LAPVPGTALGEDEPILGDEDEWKEPRPKMEMEAVAAAAVVVKSDGADRPIEGGIRRVTVRRMGVSMYSDGRAMGGETGSRVVIVWTFDGIIKR
jgi:hypothetical protein